MFILPTQATSQSADYDMAYVGLGDSITLGYGVEKGESYVDMIGSQFLDKGQSNNAKCRYANLGENGDKSDNLLGKLRNGPTVRNAVKDASVVTVSIGGNNIMLGLSEEFAIAVGLDPQNDANWLSELPATINANPTSSVLKIIARTSTTAFSNKIAKIEADYRNDLLQIVREIKKLSPNCQIIVQTIFCPTKFILLKDIIDGYIQGLNDIIVDVAPNNYTIADVHSAFANYSGSENLTNTDIMGGIYDPHPTKAGHKVIMQTVQPLLQSKIDTIPAYSRTSDYTSQGSLLSQKKYAFDFDSSAFEVNKSIFTAGATAKNYIDVGGAAGGNLSAYDLKIRNSDHIKGLEFSMIQNYDCSPIQLKLNSAVNGTSFLNNKSKIPANSKDHGVLFYVNTTNFTGTYYMMFQFEEVDISGETTRRGLIGNSEAYMQDANGNFNVPVIINTNQYLMLPPNYSGYIAIPFSSFKTIWGTKDYNFAYDLTNVKSFYIYKRSDANGGSIIFDEFDFYGRSLVENSMTPLEGQAATQGVPQNRIPAMNFEDNIFVADRSVFYTSEYTTKLRKYLSSTKLESPAQYNLEVKSYDGIPGVLSTKALRFETLPAQVSTGQLLSIGLNVSEDIGALQWLMPKGNLVSSTSESDGIAFYVDLTGYNSPTAFDLNVTWHETDCDGNGVPVTVASSSGILDEQTTSRNLNSIHGTVEGVLDNGTSVSLPIIDSSVSIANLPDGSKFKGWVKLPFGAFKTCWSSSDINGAVDFYNIGSMDLYFNSNPSNTGGIILDEFSFYGPAFAQFTTPAYKHEPTADIVDADFHADGSITDKNSNTTFIKYNGVQVGNVNVSHNGTNYQTTGMTISNFGQAVMGTLNNITTMSSATSLYQYGLTIEAFVVNKSPSGLQSFMTSTQNGGYGIYIENGRPLFETYTDTSYKDSYASQSTISTTDLTHIVGVYDFVNGKATIYINGVKSNIIDISGSFAAATGSGFNKLGFGADTDGSGLPTEFRTSNYVMVDAKVYSSALNGAQVKTAYINAVNELG